MFMEPSASTMLFSGAGAADGESTYGHPERGWPCLGRLHFEHWCTLRGVTVGVSLVVLDFPVGVFGADERRAGAMGLELPV